jgi:hypothetical protein
MSATTQHPHLKARSNAEDTMFTRKSISIGCLMSILGIAACSDSIAPDAVQPDAPPVVPACLSFTDATVKEPTLRTLSPALTDNAINTALDDHLVWTPGGAQINKLVIYLASSRAAPTTGKIFQLEAARLGFYVIGLAYPNNPGLASFCPQSANPEECYETVRMQIITGQPQTKFVQVNAANSIENRLLKLLVYLEEKFPDEHWGQFVNAESEGSATPTLAWERMIVTGHSQGAGHAAMIAKIHKIGRVVMFSGVTDGLNDQATIWLKVGATTLDRYYSFAHVRDLFYPTIVANWNALGMLQWTSTPAETNQPPYGATHLLITDILPKTGNYDAPGPHASTAVDFGTPVAADGTPLFRDAWRYLLGYCTKH